MPALLKQQKEDYWAHARTDEQRELIEAIFDGRRLNNVLTDNQFAAEIIDKIANWRYSVGCVNTDNDGSILLMECKFLGKYHGAITDKELDILIGLYVTNKLEMEYPHHIVFSQLYMSKVIEAYKDYNAKILHELTKKIETASPKELPISSSSRTDGMRWNIETAHKVIQTAKATLLHAPIISMVFVYLQHIGQIVLTIEMDGRGRQYASDIMKQTDLSGDTSLSLLIMELSPRTQKTFIYAYYLMEYFKQKELKEVLDLVQESHFNNVNE